MRGFGTVALACALVLAGCGGGGDDDVDEINALIEDTATVDDPAHCSELMTTAFLEQQGQSSDPLAECEAEEAAGGDAADSVEIANVEVDGDSATAEVAITGGASDGQTVELELVREDDRWKLDRIARFVVFDREAYFASIEAAPGSNPDLPPELAQCSVEALDSLGDAELQELVLSGDEDRSATLISTHCPAEYRAAVMDQFAGNEDLSAEALACITGALETVSDARFAELTLNANQEALQAFIAERCGGV